MNELHNERVSIMNSLTTVSLIIKELQGLGLTQNNTELMKNLSAAIGSVENAFDLLEEQEHE